jgi:hypothetical protein
MERAIGGQGVTVRLVPPRMKNFFSRLAVGAILLAGAGTVSAQVTTTVLTGGDAGQGLTLDAVNVVTAWNVQGGGYTLQGVNFTSRPAGSSFNGSIAFGGGETSADDLALAGLINEGAFAIGTPLLFTFSGLTPHAAYRFDLLQSTLGYSGREQAILVNDDLVTLVSLAPGVAYNTAFSTTADGDGGIVLSLAASAGYGGTGYQDGEVLNALVLTAVPEPATYAVLLGLIALGVAWRRNGSRRV